jgi:CRISP-associated protein Cas1
MAVIYVTDQGATVHKTGQRLVVSKQGKQLHSVPWFHVEQVVLFGNVQLSPQVRTFLLDESIDTVFLSTAGKFRGRLWSGEGKNVELRRTQFRCYEDQAFVVELARRLVRGKLQNCRTLLRRHQRTARDAAVESALARIRSCLGRLEMAETVDEIRGYEGAAAAAYFGCFGKLLTQPGFTFSVRNRRPPRDPVNALLSFGYTLLLGTITAAVQTVGLDPYLGSLHATSNGKPSLVLDLMEEFRPLLVDAVVLRAINKRQILPSDFLHREDVALPDGVAGEEAPARDEYPVLLRPESIRTWILTYEAALRNRVSYVRLGLNMSWRQVCLEQARLLARHVEGDELYESFVVR